MTAEMLKRIGLTAAASAVVALGVAAASGSAPEMPEEHVVARPRDGVRVTELRPDSPVAISVGRALPRGERAPR